MSDHTAIQWTDATWSPIVGCSRVSAGCEHCYAERMAYRLGAMGVEQYRGLTRQTDHGPRWTGETRLVESALGQPLKWRKPRMIFVCSMSDLFHESVPDEWIDRVFKIMLTAKHHTYQVLTKRPARMRQFLTERVSVPWGGFTFGVDCGRHIWIGTTCENQQAADERIPHLLATPAAVRFVSVEPMLGPVDLTDITIGAEHWDALSMHEAHEADSDGPGTRLDWVIVGGESGPGARPMHPQWARDVRDQCMGAGVPYFMKQMSRREPIPDDLMIREMPHG